MGYTILKSLFTETEEEATASATATELVEYALSWVGVTQYVWGAGRAYETDWQDYTDCSGFVHGVFSHFGYEIGGTTVYMEGSGTLIDTNSTAKALPGDIILFFTGSIAPGNSTHVGIYIGDGQMVHCTGSRSNVSPETAGPGVMVTMVSYSSRQYQVRRIIPEDASGGVGTGGHRVDPTKYSTSDLQLIWAIVAQEDNGSYEGALAVISSAMNRTESPTWSYLGNTAMKQLCAPGQYCYSNDSYWVPRLGGNVPEYVKQAVNEAVRNSDSYASFLSYLESKHYQVRDGKYLSLKPYGKPKAVRTRSLGPGYGKEELIERIKSVKDLDRSRPFVIYGDVQAVRLLMIGKREKNKNFHLTPFQRQFYHRWRNTCFIRRPDFKDSWKYKKDVVRLRELSAHISYLLEHDIGSLEDLNRKQAELETERKAAGKAFSLVKRKMYKDSLYALVRERKKNLESSIPDTVRIKDLEKQIRKSMPLEQALDLYAAAREEYDGCREYLKKIRREIKLLDGIREEAVQEWQHTASAPKDEKERKNEERIRNVPERRL